MTGALGAMDHERHGGLNALRGMLALCVFAGHTGDVFLKPNGQWPALTDALSGAASAAVMCFFVLSGYVIAMSLGANVRRGFSMTDYAVSRVARIAPPLLAVITMTWLVSIVIAEPERFSTRPAEQLLALMTWATAGELRGGLNVPLWSLEYEMHLYAIAGFVAMARFTRHKAVGIVLLALYGWAIGGFGADSRTLVYLTFGAGCAAYALRHVSWRNVGIAAAALILLACALHAIAWAIDDDAKRLYSLFAADLAVACLCALLIQAIARTGALSGLERLGDASYTIYILHFPALVFAQCIGAGIASAPLVLVACWLVGLLVERPKEHQVILRSVVSWANAAGARLNRY